MGNIVMGVLALLMLAYALFVTVQGLINGEKRMAIWGRPQFSASRWRNPGAFWYYTAWDIVVCVILAAFVFHFLRGFL